VLINLVKTLDISNLKDYSVIFKIMIPKVNKLVIYLIFRILENNVLKSGLKKSTLLEGGLDKPLKGA